MKDLRDRLVRRSVGHLSLLTVTRIFLVVLAAVGFVVCLLLLISLGLYHLGPLVDLQLDARAWGTYAAWAGAILPTLGVAVTAAIWLAGRYAESIQVAEEAALRVTLEKRDGAVVSLVNESESPLVILSATPPIEKNVLMVVRPNGPRILFAEDTESVTIRILGYVFSLGIYGTLTRIGWSEGKDVSPRFG